MNGMRRIAIPVIVAALAACGDVPSAPEPPADLLIRGARIVDGTGGPWFRGNLAVAGDTIVSVGPDEPDALQVIDAEGLVLAPGFIDMHAHSEYGLVVDPRALSKTAQGRDHRGARRAPLGGAGHGARGGRPDDGGAAHRAGLDHPRGLSRPAGVRRGGPERRLLRGLGTGARLRGRLRGTGPDRGGTSADGGARRPGDGGGGVRAGERPGLHPERLHEHGGADPADAGGGRVRRLLRDPPAQRTRRARGGDHHRPRGGHRGRDPPPELHLERPHPGIRGDDRRGPGCGRGRDRETSIPTSRAGPTCARCCRRGRRKGAWTGCSGG